MLDQLKKLAPKAEKALKGATVKLCESKEFLDFAKAFNKTADEPFDRIDDKRWRTVAAKCGERLRSKCDVWFWLHATAGEASLLCICGQHQLPSEALVKNLLAFCKAIQEV